MSSMLRSGAADEVGAALTSAVVDAGLADPEGADFAASAVAPSSIGAAPLEGGLEDTGGG
jgi:hypothetical protein